jgi:hypothetical protein
MRPVSSELLSTISSTTHPVFEKAWMMASGATLDMIPA